MNSNRKTVIILIGIAFAMLGLGFGSDYLYDQFCKITGYGGTPGKAEENLSEVLDRKITVKFDSNITAGLPWTFTPDEPSMQINLGASGLAYYTAKNESDFPITGIANFNVTPIKAAPFFIKTDCFCYEEQTLQPGQEMPLPVLFFVDPQLDEDSRLGDIEEITLSYTFFEAKNPKIREMDQAATASRDSSN